MAAKLACVVWAPIWCSSLVRSVSSGNPAAGGLQVDRLEHLSDACGLVESSQLLEAGQRSLEQLAGAADVVLGDLDPGTGGPGLGQLIARAHHRENSFGLGQLCTRANGIIGDGALAEQSAGHTLQASVADFVADAEDFLADRPRSLAIALPEVAFGEPHRELRAREAQSRAIVPGQRVGEG